MIVEWIVSIILILIFLGLCAFAFMTVVVVVTLPTGNSSTTKKGYTFINDDGEELGAEHALLAENEEQETESLWW